VVDFVKADECVDGGAIVVLLHGAWCKDNSSFILFLGLGHMIVSTAQRAANSLLLMHSLVLSKVMPIRSCLMSISHMSIGAICVDALEQLCMITKSIMPIIHRLNFSVRSREKGHVQIYPSENRKTQESKCITSQYIPTKNFNHYSHMPSV
jgi:hypothetical protein